MTPSNINYHRELEKAARQMILVRRADVLIKLILRTILRNIKVGHAGVFLYDKHSKEYVVKISKGKKGAKIPEGFTKVKKDNPIIRYFTDKTYAPLGRDFMLAGRLEYLGRELEAKNDRPMLDFIERLKDEMSLYQADAYVPGFYRNNLVGILFLGAKEDKSAFSPEELGFLSVLASDVVMAIQNSWLFEDLRKQLDVNKRLFHGTVKALSEAIEAKDKYTMGHTQRVAELSIAIADTLGTMMKIENLERFKEDLNIAALLHDIGKIAIPEVVLNKPDALSNDELEYIIKHPMSGAEILNPIGEFEDVILGVKYHHERYDGKGYPFSLKGEEIPLIAAIISVADTFDAMTTDRAYKKALPEAEAIEEIRRNSGKQFNPTIVDAFLKSYRINA